MVYPNIKESQYIFLKGSQIKDDELKSNKLSMHISQLFIYMHPISPIFFTMF